MSTIQKDQVVLFNYTLTDSDGKVLDKTEETPLAYLHGHQNIIPGLERALEGKSAGDDVNVTVEPGQGYGDYDEQLIQSVPREMFQGVDNIEPGMQFQAQAEQGVQVVTVKSVSDEAIEVDANHPLAGQSLTFDVQILEVRDANEEELNHGHPHVGDDAHH